MNPVKCKKCGCYGRRCIGRIVDNRWRTKRVLYACDTCSLVELGRVVDALIELTSKKRLRTK